MKRVPAESLHAVRELTFKPLKRRETMNAIRQYSNLFSCIYDESQPTGMIGRGHHYSVFRAIQDSHSPDSDTKFAQDFCIIWDEDHDERIIKIVEELFMCKLLKPVLFIGERKGHITIIFNPIFVSENPDKVESHLDKISLVIKSLDTDDWSVSAGSFASFIKGTNLVIPEEMIVTAFNAISSDHERVEAYLSGIDALWMLGLKKWEDVKRWSSLKKWG